MKNNAKTSNQSQASDLPNNPKTHIHQPFLLLSFLLCSSCLEPHIFLFTTALFFLVDNWIIFWQFQADESKARAAMAFSQERLREILTANFDFNSHRRKRMIDRGGLSLSLSLSLTHTHTHIYATSLIFWEREALGAHSLTSHWKKKRSKEGEKDKLQRGLHCTSYPSH